MTRASLSVTSLMKTSLLGAGVPKDRGHPKNSIQHILDLTNVQDDIV